MVMAVVGFFVLGVMAGFIVYRELEKFVSHFREGVGICELCKTKGWLVSCRRCSRRVAMCCYFAILGRDEPEGRPLRKRKSVHVCERCLTPDEKEILERMF